MTLKKAQREAISAKALVCMIDARRLDRRESARDRLTAMLGALDTIILRLPEDPSDDLVREIERVVTSLHTADACLKQGNQPAGSQALDLAYGRLVRLAERLEMEPELS